MSSAISRRSLRELPASWIGTATFVIGKPVGAVVGFTLASQVPRVSRSSFVNVEYGLLFGDGQVNVRHAGVTLQRVGSSQRMILRWLARAISSAQGDGSVRPGEPQEIAVMLLLIAQSAVLSHGTVADLISEAGWERELRAALDGLLRP